MSNKILTDKKQQKTRLSASFLTDCDTDVSTKYSWIHVDTLYHSPSISQQCVDPTGIEPASQISWIQLHTSDGPTQIHFIIGGNQ